MNCARCLEAIGGDEKRVEFRGQTYHFRCEYERPVVLVNVDLSFNDMAMLVFRWTLATIPTALFWFVIAVLVWSLRFL